jgi:hypothetical protein
MRRKELPRIGLVAAALTGRTPGPTGTAPRRSVMSLRQFQRFKEGFSESGAPARRHHGRGRLLHRRLSADKAVHV